MVVSYSSEHRLAICSLWVAVLITSTALPAIAAEVIVLDPITIEGHRPIIPDQPQRVQIITAKEIERSGCTNLAQLLQKQTAFAIRQYGPMGSLSSATARGSLGEGILILRDGIKLNSPEQGSTDLSTVSLAGVDHIEIMYGGGSSLYGSEAIGGVINLISKTSSSDRLETGLGSWGERYVDLDAGQDMGNRSFAFSLRRLYADNDYPYYYRGQSQPRANSSLDDYELSLGGQQKWGSDRLSLNLNLSQESKGVPGPVNFPTPNATEKDLSLLGAIKWSQQWNDELKQVTTLSHHVSGLDYADPGSSTDLGSNSQLDTTDAQSEMDWQTDSNELRGGLGFTNDTLNSTTYGGKNRLTGALFLHDSWYMSRLTWLGDLRLDDSSAFGLNASPRLGFSYFLNDAVHFRGAVGQAYRGPTFNDLYWPSQPDAKGNPNLQAETTRVYELGGDYVPWKPVKLETTLFYNQGSNTIAWEPGNGGVWSPINIGQTESKGIELVSSYTPYGWLSFKGDTTWLSAIDRSAGVSNGMVLMYRPDWVTKASMTWHPLKVATIDLGWSYTGTRYTTATDTDSLPPYQLWSLDASYRPTSSDTLSLDIDNLLNTYYESEPYYPMPGRALKGAWAHTF